MKILGIETSSPRYSLCVCEDEHLICEITKDRRFDKKSRDGQFFLEAQKIIDGAGPHGIDVIAICIGPGQFTSLRVGLGLAKGLCYGKGLPIVSVNTLDALGVSSLHFNQPVLATINAYHKEIYAARYEQGVRKSEYMLTTPAELASQVRANAVVVGSGVEVFEDAGVRGDGLVFIKDELYCPDAHKVVRLALPHIHSRQFEDIATLEPFYIKKTDAERNYHKTHAL